MDEQDVFQSAYLISEGSGIRPFCVDDLTTDHIDPETVKKAQNGDKEAFSKLFWQTYRYVLGISKRYLRRDEDIYDAVQETYTGIYENLGKLKVPEAFVTWTGKIAATCARAIAEKISATGADPLEDEELVEIDNTAGNYSAEVKADVTAVLSQMDPADVELLTFVYYDRLRVTEIAKMQGVPATTVYSRLNAAKRKLKELLKIRGIERAVYGGDIIALITTALRNAIGTNLLSMAVAAEILHSVVGKSTKGAAVVAAVARKQRNAAALKIASWLLASAMLVFGVIAILVNWINYRAKPQGTPPKDLAVANSAQASDMSDASKGDSTIGNPGEISSSDGYSSINSSTDTVSENNSSGGTVSTGTSGDITDTADPDQGNENTGNTSSFGGASSSRPSSTVSTNTSSSRPSTSSTMTSSSKPSTSSTATSSSKPSTSSTATPSYDDEFDEPEDVAVTSLPAVYSSVRFDRAVNTMGNTSNNIFANTYLNREGLCYVAREGDTLYYSDVYTTKTTSVNGGRAEFADFRASDSINVVNGQVCYKYGSTVVLPGGNYTAHPGLFLIINGTAYVAEKQSSGTYSIYAVDIYTLADRLVASNVTYATGIAANTDMLIYNSGNKLYKYDLKTQKTTLFREDFSGKMLLMCGQYVAYSGRIVNIYDPSIAVNTGITPLKFFWHNGGMIVDDSGTGYYLSDLTTPVQTLWAESSPYDDYLFFTFGFDNEEYVFFSNPDIRFGSNIPEIECGGMHRLYPDGTGYKMLAMVRDTP